MKKNIIVSILVTMLYAGIYYYLMYPPINIHSSSFLFYLFTFFMVRSLIIVPILFIGVVVVNIIVSPLFQSKEYYNRIKIEDGDFKEEVKEVDFNKLPLLDRDSTLKIGDRTMGGMSDLVSQFDVSRSNYTCYSFRISWIY